MGEIIDRIKGKAKQAQGKVTGNRVRQAEGVVDEMKGKAKGAFDATKIDAKRTVKKSSSQPPARSP